MAPRPETARTVRSRDALLLEATQTAFSRAYPSSALHGRSGALRRLEGLVRNEFEEGNAFCRRVQAQFFLIALRSRVSA